MTDPLGLAPGTVRVVQYDPRWAQLYAAEAERLTLVLANIGVPDVVLEHTGSTAVPGLAAKPIIDILAGRPGHASRRGIIEAFVHAGYLYRGEQGIEGRDFFRRGEPRSYHLHLSEIGSRFWLDHRAFRDYLIAHADARQAYAALKQALAAAHPANREAYISGKTAFVQEILGRAQAAHERSRR